MYLHARVAEETQLLLSPALEETRPNDRIFDRKPEDLSQSL